MEKDLEGLRINRRTPEPGRRRGILVLSVGLVLVLGAASYFYLRPERKARPQALAAAVAAPQPSPPASREVLIVSGYVVAHHRIDLGSKVMGKVAWVGVEKGDRVRKGQLLVKLDDREYRAQLDQALGNQQSAAARLAELEAGSRPQEIQRAEARVDRDRADLENAERELDRLRKLLESTVVSRQEVDNARARQRMAQAELHVAEKDLELLRLGPRREEIERARADLESARAAVRYARTLLEATEIRAPIAGTVLERIVEVGEMVTTSFAGERGAKSSVVALADLSDLQVELDVSQADFNRISRRQECRMVPEAYPDREYRCRIDEISPEANRQKATIQVKVKILEPDEYLRPEMTARVTFLKRSAKTGGTV